MKILVYFAGPKPDVVVRIRRSVVQIQSKHPSIQLVVEVAAPDRGRNNYAPLDTFIQPPKSFPISVIFSQWFPYFS